MSTQAVSCSAKRLQVAQAPTVQGKWADKMPIALLNCAFSYLNSKDTCSAVLACRDWRPMRTCIAISALRKQMGDLNASREALGQTPLSALQFGEMIHARWAFLKRLSLSNAFDTIKQGNLLPAIFCIKPDELAVEPSPDESLIESLRENAVTPKKLQLSAFHENLSSKSVTNLELFFAAVAVDPTNVMNLRCFPAMTSLRITTTSTVALGALLSNLPTLRSLCLEKARLSAYTRADYLKADVTIDMLLIKQPHKTLTELDFEDTTINFDALFSYMEKMPSLEWLTFRTCTLVEAAPLPLAQAAAAATGVRTYSLTTPNQNTPVDLQTLRKPKGWGIDRQYSFGEVILSAHPAAPEGSIFVAGRLTMRPIKT